MGQIPDRGAYGWVLGGFSFHLADLMRCKSWHISQEQARSKRNHENSLNHAWCASPSELHVQTKTYMISAMSPTCV